LTVDTAEEIACAAGCATGPDPTATLAETAAVVVEAWLTAGAGAATGAAVGV
jgi:hypothetical protein